MRSGEEAGPRPPLTLGFPVSSWRGRPQGTVWASGCLPASHAAMRRAQREAEPVSCWPRGTRHQLDQDRGLGRAPPLWVCVGRRWLPGAQLRPPTMSLAPHGRPSESPQSTRTPFQEPPSDGGLVAAPSLHLSPPSVFECTTSSTTPQEQQDRAGTRHPAGGASPRSLRLSGPLGLRRCPPTGVWNQEDLLPSPPSASHGEALPDYGFLSSSEENSNVADVNLQAQLCEMHPAPPLLLLDQSDSVQGLLGWHTPHFPRQHPEG